MTYDLRKWHHRVGIVLAVFLTLQAGSGLLISFRDMVAGSHSHGGMALYTGLAFLHHGGGVAGSVYRTILGAATLWMAVTGSFIFFQMKARSRQSRKE
jgi:hypothetical protein